VKGKGIQVGWAATPTTWNYTKAAIDTKRAVSENGQPQVRTLILKGAYLDMAAACILCPKINPSRGM